METPPMKTEVILSQNDGSRTTLGYYLHSPDGPLRSIGEKIEEAREKAEQRIISFKAL
jgi:hypothetical protein